MPQLYNNIHFIAGKRPEAQQAFLELTALYGQTHLDNADVIITLAGDGCMLHALQKTLNKNVPVYGINFGSFGFLLNNAFLWNNLHEKLSHAEHVVIYPLTMTVSKSNGEVVKAFAINEVALFRQTHQSAKIKITVDDIIRLPQLIGDGILVATPAGSTAYNLSINGPILPIDSNLLALTPISPFRPRRWRGALLRSTNILRFDIEWPDMRPVSATADSTEVRDVESVVVSQDMSSPLTILYDRDPGFKERVLQEQFA